MARIVVLESSGRKVRYLLWADVPASRQKFYANAALTSAWIDAQAADITKLRAGEIVERVVEESPDGNLAAIKTYLEGKLTAFQAEIDARSNWPRYGTTFDGTSWSNVTVD